MGLRVNANVSLDMSGLNFSNLLYGTPTTQSSSLYILKWSNGYYDRFEGKNFHFDRNNVPNGGTVHSLEEGYGSKEFYSISGASLSVKAMVNAAFTSTINDDLNIVLKAMNGNDVVTGSNQKDLLFAAGGNDKINGRGGNDYILAGPGKDTLTGGGGSDSFVFDAPSVSSAKHPDTITDFTHADVIDLSVLGPLHFIGTSKFSGQGDEIRFERHARDTFVYGDFNGDKKADFAIHLDDAITLHKSDFYL